MKYPDNFANLIFVILELGDSILKKISDYENNIHENTDIKTNFHNIDFVYMHSILLDMGKLLSVTNSDKSGLSELDNISPPEFKERIQKIRDNYGDTIDKITTNRNRIIAHIDISNTQSYFRLGFSRVEIDRKIEDYKKYIGLNDNNLSEVDLKVISDFEALMSTSVKYERYSPSDFFDEKETFVKIVREILQVATDLNVHFYNLK